MATRRNVQENKGRLALFAQKVAPFHPKLTVKWIEDTKNVIADALSRVPFTNKRMATSVAVAAAQEDTMEEYALLKSAGQIVTVWLSHSHSSLQTNVMSLSL